MNITASFKVSINSGMALILFLASFAGLLVGVALSPAIAGVFVAAGAILVGAFGGYLKKRSDNHVKDIEAQKAGLTTGKTGDPLE